MSAARAVHVGIDLAWGTRNWTGLAAVAVDGRLLASTRVRTDAEIVDWIAGLGPRVGVAAIDAPLIVPNETGFRDCERELSSAFRAFEAGAYPANQSNAAFMPPRGAVVAQHLNLPMDPAGPRDQAAIEVYPHPAMVGLWQLPRTLKDKQRKTVPFKARRRQFLELLDRIEGEASLRAAESPRWRDLRAVALESTSHGHLNRVEDEVDGIICAWLAWLWAADDARLKVYGDVQRGYIVAPNPPGFSQTSVDIDGDTGSRWALEGPTGRQRLSHEEALLLEEALIGHRGR